MSADSPEAAHPAKEEHGAQDAGAAANVPAGHVAAVNAQEVAPAVLYNPAAQGGQNDAPPVLCVPAAQKDPAVHGDGAKEFAGQKKPPVVGHAVTADEPAGQ